MLFKKKRNLSLLLTTSRFPLLILMKKIVMKKILMKKYIKFYFEKIKRIKINEVSGFPSSLLKYQKFLKLRTQKFHFPKYKKYKKFFQGFRFLKWIFLFLGLGLKSAGFHFREYKKSFFF